MNSSSKKVPEITNENFPIIAIGASAGGLEAFETFFKSMTSDNDIAFIIIAHLDPTHASLLPELLQKKSKMEVHQIKDGMKVLANNIYVIPPNKMLSILNRTLQLFELPKVRGANLPIDSFFKSLAIDQGHRAICIILSGTGTDGTIGLKAIKDEFGMCMAQDVESAKYDGMPRSAIATGLVDFILPPEEMPTQLLKFINHTLDHRLRSFAEDNDITPNALQKIFIILRAHTEHDFSLYKKNTICRRIERRMNVHQIDDINQYSRYLEESEIEVNILFKELLIGVTNFFRDEKAFDILKSKYIPDLLATLPSEYTIRVWVTGCSSGEEAYSLAIILQEVMLDIGKHFNVQIFGTDIDEDAIKVARAGIYPASILTNVSNTRIKRYFNKQEDGKYQIKKSIREMLVFAEQDVIKDPPFTKLDILSCRNLLIYLGAALQKKLFPIFNYSLKKNGLLFLGTSESIGQSNKLFTPLDKKWKVFRRSDNTNNPHPFIDSKVPAQIDYTVPEQSISDTIRKAEAVSALQLVETILQESNTPPCAIIDDNCNIIYIHGRTGLFLEPPEGKSSLNIIEMARPGIKDGLSASIRKVAKNKQEVILRDLHIESADPSIYLDLIVRAVIGQSVMRGLMMVVFEEKTASSKSTKKRKSTIKSQTRDKSVDELTQELQYTKENLQTTIEELETSNEELKSTNEELQSTNEELQSTNEEMETSKEELQSLNEESVTVNAELQSRIDELSHINDDMKNLLDSTNIATLFLDSELCIRRFTPKATEIIPLSNTDSGRSISHLSSSLIDVDLAEYGKLVLSDLIVREEEVRSKDGSTYLMKVRPYKTVTNVIDGVVITFDNDTVRRKKSKTLIDSEERFRMLFELSNDSVVLIDAKTGAIKEANEYTYDSIGYNKEEILTLTLFDIQAEESVKQTKKHIKEIIANGDETFESKYKCKDGSIKAVLIKTKAFIIKEKDYLLSTWRDVD
jgi:two-component system CheB/CheR fusion protein